VDPTGRLFSKLDTDGGKSVDIEEWLEYLRSLKEERGEKAFDGFMNHLASTRATLVRSASGVGDDLEACPWPGWEAVPTPCCPITGEGLALDVDYPLQISASCVARAVDEHGRELKFDATRTPMCYLMRNGRPRESLSCFVDGQWCYAQRWDSPNATEGCVIQSIELLSNQEVAQMFGTLLGVSPPRTMSSERKRLIFRA